MWHLDTTISWFRWKGIWICNRFPQGLCFHQLLLICSPSFQILMNVTEYYSITGTKNLLALHQLEFVYMSLRGVCPHWWVIEELSEHKAFNWLKQLETVLVIWVSCERPSSRYTSRSLAKGTGEMILSSMEIDIVGNCLMSCGRPITSNFVSVRV